MLSKIANNHHLFTAEYTSHTQINVATNTCPEHTRTRKPWWRHQMETFSALLAICAGNSPATSKFPSQRPVTRICARINAQVNIGEAGDLRRHRAHYDVTVMHILWCVDSRCILFLVITKMIFFYRSCNTIFKLLSIAMILFVTSVVANFIRTDILFFQNQKRKRKKRNLMIFILVMNASALRMVKKCHYQRNWTHFIKR